MQGIDSIRERIIKKIISHLVILLSKKTIKNKTALQFNWRALHHSSLILTGSVPAETYTDRFDLTNFLLIIVV